MPVIPIIAYWALAGFGLTMGSRLADGILIATLGNKKNEDA